jgi:glutaryl-CoA dehydrogenase (non-decarboxylating)
VEFPCLEESVKYCYERSTFEKKLENFKWIAQVIYERTRETIMQTEYVLGYREDKPLNKTVPAWKDIKQLLH